jgi:WD40 repeat protein
MVQPDGTLLATGSEDGIARIWTSAGDLYLVLSMHQVSTASFFLAGMESGSFTARRLLDQVEQVGHDAPDRQPGRHRLLLGALERQGPAADRDALGERHGLRLVRRADLCLVQPGQVGTSFVDIRICHGLADCVSRAVCSIHRSNPIHRFRGHKDEVNACRFDPTRTVLATCSDDKTVRLWSMLDILPTGPKREESTPVTEVIRNGGTLVLEGHTKDVQTIMWHPLAGLQDGQPRLIAS